MKKKYIIFTLLTMLFAVTCISAGKVSAQSIYEVGVNSLNIREEPAAQSDVVAYVQRGDQLDVTEIQFGWAKVNINGKVGWVASHYLVPSVGTVKQKDNQPAKQTEVMNSNISKITIAGEIVNIRSGPGTNHSIVEKASRGQQYTYIRAMNDWIEIQLTNGTKAWVAGWLTSSSSAETKTETVANNDSKKLSNKVIVLDAGHGGMDPGSIALNGVFEKQYTLNTALHVKNQLEALGAQVVLTRANDSYVGLAERVRISQAYPNAMFISLHYNGALNQQANGINTFYYHNEDRSLANAIQKQLITKTNLTNRGAQFGNYYVLRNNNIQSLLIELGFITNNKDLSKIDSQQFKNEIAEAIAQGIINYYN